MANFLNRLLVGAALLPVTLGLVWLGGWWLFALAMAMAAVGIHELCLATRPLRPLLIAGYGGVTLTVLGAQLGGTQWALGGFLATIALAFVVKGVSDTKGSATVSVGTTVLGVAWIGLGAAFLLLLRDIPAHGRLACFAVLLAIFASDTFAFFGGKLLGRHKLAPTLSPGKTWEGLAFGIAAAVLVVWISTYERDWLTQGDALLLGVAVAVAAPLGDLFESGLKRDMNVKDTGKILGGHGGVLDRVDSLLFAIPVAYYVVAAFGKA